MSICVVGRPDSELGASAVASTLRDAIALLPKSSVLIVPTSAHAQQARRYWAELRPGTHMPDIQTMASFVRGLYRQLPADGVHMMEDAEAELLLDMAVRDCDEAFCPPGLSVDSIIRWKQELLNVYQVEQAYLDDDMPRRLDELRRVIPVWKAYEQRKADRCADRGDVTLHVVDALATHADRFVKRSVLVFLTHGLTIADRTILHLLSSNDWDVAVHFAPLIEVSHDFPAEPRSVSAATWMIAHGWTQLDGVTDTVSGKVYDRTWETKRDEIRRATAAFKQWHADGFALDDMCAIVPSSGSYDDQMRDVARRAGVPLSFAERKPLRRNGYATAVLAACNTVVRGWALNDVDRLINSGYVSFGTLPVGKLSRAASRARIVGGNGWRAWLDRFDEAQQLLIEAAARDADDPQLQQNIALITDGKTIVSWLADVIDPNTDIMSASRFGQWLQERVLYGLGMIPPQELLDSISKYVVISDRHIKHALSLAEHVSQWWDVVSTIDGSHETRMVHGVTVCKPHEVRGRVFRRVIALGFVDGELPARKKDVVHEELLAGLREALDVEAYSDIMFASASDGILVRSAPRMDDGNETSASVFLGTQFESCGSTVLDEIQQGMLLDAADVRAYRDGSSIDSLTRQAGLDVQRLTDEIRNNVLAIANRAISPSRVDTAAQCPYQFFVKNILGIQKETTDNVALSPIERGSLLHAVVQEFYKRLQSHASSTISSLHDIRSAFVDLTNRPLQELYDLLLTVYREQRQHHPTGHLYDVVERRMLEDNNDRFGLLRRWLLNEIKMQGVSNFRPFLFELTIVTNIQIGERPSESINLRIDRVDGAIENDELHCIVIDYKTAKSSVPKHIDIARGLSSQLPLYGRAIEQYFADLNITAHMAGGAYRTFGRSVRDMNDPNEYSRLPSKDAIDVPSEVDGLLSLAERHVNVIRSAHYPVVPAPKACDRCTAREICRIDHWDIYYER